MGNRQVTPILQDQQSNELAYNGILIHEKGKRLSLTDMWKAAGETENKDPRQWLRSSEAKHFIEFLSTSLNVGNSHIIKTVKGKGGGTWAHWQIALAYAKYLSPEFHIWCNQIVRDHMEGRLAEKATSLTPYDKSIIGNMIKNCSGAVIREELQNLIPALVEPLVKARLADGNILIRHGKTADEIWRANNLPRLKNAAVWIGNRLDEMGCAIGNHDRAEHGAFTVRLFDPDKASICLRNGLLHTAKIYASERAGQGKLRLVAFNKPKEENP